MREKVLEILLQSKDYISGETLSHELGVSRTAVWKAINKLKDEGYEITSVRNKGYKLTAVSKDLNTDGIKVSLPDVSRFQTVKLYDTIDSTITEAKRLFMDGRMKEGLILAEEQTAGKGRRGRFWSSEKHAGIWSSLLLKPDLPPQNASMLTLIAGLSVAEAIRELTDLEAYIKWPNDVVVGGRKVCGILTEMSAEMDYIHYVVVGIGINVNQQSFEENLANIGTSLALEKGMTIDRLKLLVKMLELFEGYYEQFLETKSLSFMMEAYNTMCINVDMSLKIESYGDIIYGKGLYVNDDGTLKVECKDGSIINVNAGEVSVRGLYGYAE